MSESESTSEPTPERSRTRIQQLWQLHLPLAVWLCVCAFATVVEYNRAMQGVDRAWSYTFQWPLFGVFAIFVWWRLLNEKSVTRSVVDFYRRRTEAMKAEAEDPELRAWNEYVRDLKGKSQP